MRFRTTIKPDHPGIVMEYGLYLRIMSRVLYALDNHLERVRERLYERAEAKHLPEDAS